MRTDIRSDVDFVLTFEEMDGIFDARHVDVEKIEEDPEASMTLPRTAVTLRWQAGWPSPWWM